MASADALRVLRELQSRPDSRICVDCDTKNPQWATVSYGTFMCLECSGRHRGLGVHISFVRSVTMDAWSADQLKKMQAGGNARMNEFFKQYGVDKYMDIKDKYNSRVAEIYREKIKAEVEGRPFTPPPPSSVPPPSAAAPARGGGGGAAPADRARGGNDSWGDWGDKDGSGGGANGAAGARSNGNASSGFSGSSEYSRSQYMDSAARKDEFFASKVQSNASRPEGLPPSQGGKYVGFGSTPPPRGPARAGAGAGGVDDVTQIFSRLGTVAGAAATTAAGAVRSGTSNVAVMLQERGVVEGVQQTSKVLGERGYALAQTGWSGLQSLVKNVASTVETVARDQGIALDLTGGTARPGGAHTSPQHQHMAHSAGAHNGGATNGGGGGGFAGFDEGDDGGWGRPPAPVGGGRNSARSTSATATRPASGGSDGYHRSVSSPALTAKPEDDEWGKW